MPGEIASDERIQEQEQAFKINVFIKAIDTVSGNLRERFSEEHIGLMRQMYLFTPRHLLTDKYIDAADVDQLSKFYKFDAHVIARELNEFRSIYAQLHEMIDVEDSLSVSVRTSGVNSVMDPASQESDDDFNETEEVIPALTSAQWAANGFIKPLRVITELSGFSSLKSLYTILVSLAITSSSAERVMSKIKIVKNRLRTTMLDDWFSSLTILASEKDILDQISVETIIDKFATSSTPLCKLLSYTQ